MRSEQIDRLVAIEEELVDVFTNECKPKAWPTMRDVQSRGDRYWHKKNALATLTLVGRIQTVLRDARGDGGSGKEGEPGGGSGLDEEKLHEQEAARLEKIGVAVLKRHGLKGR